MIKALLLIVSLLVTPSFAFDLKLKAIEVVIPFAPGGGVDTTYKHFEKYARARGVNTVAIYKPGAEGLIAMRDLSSGSNDGYRISFTTTAVYSNAVAKEPLNVVPLIAIKNPLGTFVTSSKSNIKTFDQLINVLKTNDNIKIGSGAPGQALVWEQLFDLTGIPSRQLIPYKGGQPVLVDLLGGHIDVAMLPAALTSQQAKAGNIQIVAHTGVNKIKDFDSAIALSHKYPKWGLLDIFIVVTPQIGKIQAEQWESFIQDYLSDASVQNDFVNEHSEHLPSGDKVIKQALTNIKTFMNKLPR